MVKWEYMEVAPESLLVGRGGYIPAITRLRELGESGWEHYWTNPNGTMLLK